jgi:SPP1 gp7 family putative phage head morphogenesis protein
MNPLHRLWKLFGRIDTRPSLPPAKQQAIARLAEQDRAEDASQRSLSKESGAVVGTMDRFGGMGIENPHELYQNNLGLVDEMMRDEAVGTFVEMKKSGALSVNWKIEPASDDDHDQMIGDATQTGFDNLEGSMVEAMHDMFSAVEYGYSATNVTFELLEAGEFKGKLGLHRLKTKPPHFVKFDTDEFLNILPDGILFQNENGLTIDRMPKDEFAVYSYRKRFANPYGYGDCVRAYDRWNSKKWVNKFWDIHLERYATGTIIAQYDSENRPPEQEFSVVWDFLQRKQVRAGLQISDLWKIMIQEASSGTSDVFEGAIAQRNTAIARALLLPDLLGFTDKSGGAYALGKKHFDVFLWILLRLHKDIGEVMEEQIIRRLVDLNYGPQDAYPTFVFEPLTDEQKVQWLTNVFTALEKGALTPDLEIENAVRKMLELAEKEEEEEEEAGGSPPPPQSDEPPIDDDDIEEQPMDDIDDNPPGGFQSPQPAKLVRPLNQYEQKMDFETMIEFTNEAEDAVVDRWSDLMRENQDSIIDWTRRTDIVHNQEYNLVQKTPMSKSVEQRKAMARYLMSGCYFGSLQGQQEIDRSRKGDMSLHRSTDFASFAVVDIPLTEIEKVFKDKGLMVSSKITRAAITAKKDAFFITNVENEAVLSNAKKIIMRGIKRGDQRWTEKELKRMFNRYLSTGEITDATLGQEWRVRQLARENFNRAMNDGRKAYFKDPDVDSFIAAYEWSSVIDDATTDYCKKMDQKVFRKEDLDAEGWPPADYGCRSVVVVVTEGEKFTFNKIPTTIERRAGFETHVH